MYLHASILFQPTPSHTGDKQMPTSGTAGARKSGPPHDEKINLRLSRNVKTLIDAAAEMTGKSRTEFVIESARQHAVDVLLDQRLFELEPGQWKAFEHALAEPPMPGSALRRLLAKKPPWEK
jgi:uncharacterized protein (DUF1778 family)